jgi:hypothetical protein
MGEVRPRATARVRVGERYLWLRPHAVEQYRDRVKPAMELVDALADLIRLLTFAEWVDRPAWVETQAEVEGDEWLAIGDGIVFPVSDDRIVTCMDRGGLGDGAQRVRSENRRDKTANRRRPGKQQHFGKVQKDARRRAREGRDGGFDGR